MTRFFTSRRLMVLLASFILLSALVGLTIREREKPTWPEAFLIDAFGWAQGLIYKPVHHIADFFEDAQNIKNLYNENAQLKANLNDYASMSVRLQELEKENQQLKNDAKLKNTTDFDLQATNVIGRSPSTWNSEITIDVGSREGSQKDMAVITANQGLVGRVTEVTPYHAKVLLITDKVNIGISAIVKNGDETNPAYGIVSGVTQDLSQNQKASVQMSLITLLTQIKPGQQVVTSGLSEFPKNLVVGKVVNVSPDKLGLTQTAEIEPAANLNNLDILYVVKKSKAK
ncbi:MAG: rod shape-determining protein MreC [Tumebacillaceae bacterium]